VLVTEFISLLSNILFSGDLAMLGTGDSKVWRGSNPEYE